MSLVIFRKKMHGWFKYVMFVIAVIFVVGVFAYVGMNGPKGNETTSTTGVIAKVDGVKIDRVKYETEANVAVDNQTKQMNQRLTPFQESMTRGKVFDQTVSDIARSEAARKEGIRVSGRDVNKAIDKAIEQRLDAEKEQLLGKGPKTDKALDEAYRKYGKSLAERKKELSTGLDKDTVRQQLMVGKLIDKWKSGLDVSDKAFMASYDQVIFSQITISTKGKSEAQAEQQAKDLAKKLRAGGDFAAAAKQYSDDPYKDKGGSRGFPMLRSYMEPELANVVFNLKPGEIGDPIKMPLGYTIVKLDSKKNAAPADLSDPKKKKQYYETFKSNQENMILGQKMEKVEKEAKVTIYDPELRGYRLLMNAFKSTTTSQAERKANVLAAIKAFNDAAKSAGGDSNAAARDYSMIAYTMNQLRRPEMGMAATKEEAAKYKEETKNALVQALKYTESDDLRLMMAEIAIDEKDWKTALDNLEKAALSEYDTNPQSHMAILALYQRMKSSGLPEVNAAIQKETAWQADYTKKMKEAQKAQAGATKTVPMQPAP